MAAENFNPIDHAREPREKGWEEETEQIIEHIRNRGDLRIGQLLINAISKDVEMPDRPEPEGDIKDLDEEEAKAYIEECRHHRNKCKAKVEQAIWNMEADKLLKLLDQLENEGDKK